MDKEEILFGTKEWAPYNFNFMSGCSNDCTYCYAKEIGRIKVQEENIRYMEGRGTRIDEGEVVLQA